MHKRSESSDSRELTAYNWLLTAVMSVPDAPLALSPIPPLWLGQGGNHLKEVERGWELPGASARGLDIEPVRSFLLVRLKNSLYP